MPAPVGREQWRNPKEADTVAAAPEISTVVRSWGGTRRGQESQNWGAWPWLPAPRPSPAQGPAASWWAFWAPSPRISESSTRSASAPACYSPSASPAGWCHTRSSTSSSSCPGWPGTRWTPVGPQAPSSCLTSPSPGPAPGWPHLLPSDSGTRLVALLSRIASGRRCCHHLAAMLTGFTPTVAQLGL